MYFSSAQRLMLALLLVCTRHLAASAFDLIARQTDATPRSTTSTQSLASTTEPAIAPCCVIWAGFNGVLVNSWYTQRVTQFTATVVTTVLQYRDAVVTANSTTIYLPKNSTFIDFGYFGGPVWPTVVTALTAVPTDLVPSDLLEVDEYGATTVVRSNETGATWLGEDLAIASPTPYALYHNIEIVTYTPDYENIATMMAPQTTYDRALCGSSTLQEWLSFSEGSWTYKATSAFIPPSSTLYEMIASRVYGVEQFVTAIPLPAPLPNNRIWVDLPAGISSSLVANQTLRSMYPWITNCFTWGGMGEPTVHIAVDQLTTDATSTVVIDATLEAQRSLSPTTSPSTRSIALSTAHVEQTAPKLNLPSSTASSPAAADHPSVEVIQGSPATSTFSSTTLPAQQIAPSMAVVGGMTMSVGGTAITHNGATISLITEAGSLAVVVDGSTTQAVPTSLASRQGITLGDKIVTLAPTAPTEVIIGGVTLKSGEATVISGQTVSLAGTNVVIASGNVKTTQDIAGIILNGLGASVSSSKSSTRYTGAATTLRSSIESLFAVLLVALWHLA